MVLGRIKCLSGRHQMQKNGTVLDKSTPAMQSQGFRKIGCFRCPHTEIVKRPNIHTKKQIDTYNLISFEDGKVASSEKTTSEIQAHINEILGE